MDRDPADKIWVTADNRFLHVKEIGNLHLRRLITMHQNRLARIRNAIEDAESDLESQVGNLKDADPEGMTAIAGGILEHQQRLTRQYKFTKDWLDVFEEEKSRRNMVDYTVDVEF